MTRYALALLTVVNLLNYLDRYLLAALLPAVTTALALNHGEGGTLVSAFVLGYFIFSPIFGYLGDRMRRPVLMAVGVAIWSLATASTALATTFTFIFVTRLLVGIGEASFATIAPGYIKDRSHSPEQLNSLLSIFYTAIPVGAALAYVLSGALIKHMDWSAIFLVAGLPGLLLAIGLLAFRESRPTTSEPVAPLLPGLRQILSVPALQYSIGGYALQAFALNGVATWITTLGELRGYGYEDSSTIFGVILVITGLFGTLIGGRLANYFTARSKDKIRTMFLFIAISAAIGIPALAGCFIVQDKVSFFALCALAEFVIFAGTAPLNSIIVLSAPPSLVTLTQGVTIATINLIGALLAPITIGALSDAFGLPQALQLTSVALLGAVLLWWRGGRIATIRP
jgi:MFS family permease